MEPWLEWLVAFQFVEAALDARGDYGLGAIQAALGYQLFSLTRISFVLDTRVSPSDDPIQTGTLFGVVGAWPQSR